MRISAPVTNVAWTEAQQTTARGLNATPSTRIPRAQRHRDARLGPKSDPGVQAQDIQPQWPCDQPDDDETDDQSGRAHMLTRPMAAAVTGRWATSAKGLSSGTLHRPLPRRR